MELHRIKSIFMLIKRVLNKLLKYLPGMSNFTLLGTQKISYTGDKVNSLWVPIIDIIEINRNHDISDRKFNMYFFVTIWSTYSDNSLCCDFKHLVFTAPTGNQLNPSPTTLNS